MSGLRLEQKQDDGMGEAAEGSVNERRATAVSGQRAHVTIVAAATDAPAVGCVRWLCAGNAGRNAGVNFSASSSVQASAGGEGEERERDVDANQESRKGDQRWKTRWKRRRG